MSTFPRAAAAFSFLAVSALLSTAAQAGTSARFMVGATVVRSARVRVESVATLSQVRLMLGSQRTSRATVSVGSGKSVSVPVSGEIDVPLPRSEGSDVVVAVQIDE